jgi:3-hydroxyacyl-CoA dehydrogenase
MDFYREIGKKPIHIKKKVRGHVANRLQAALWREAVHLVTEGVDRSLTPTRRSHLVQDCAGH